MGLEFDLLLSRQLPPIQTAATAATRPDGDEKNNAAAVVDGCATPTSAANVLRAPSVCPPAPRKPRPAKRKRPHHLSSRHRRCGPTAAAQPAPLRRWFIAVPYDVLAAAFVARGVASACRLPAGKKIRVHVLG